METQLQLQIQMERTLDIILSGVCNQMVAYQGDVLLTRGEIIDNLLCYGKIECFCHRTHFDTERRFKDYYCNYSSALDYAEKTLGVDYILALKYDRETGRLTTEVRYNHPKDDGINDRADAVIDVIRRNNVFCLTQYMK